VEAKDRKQLESPEDCLSQGGEIFFALIETEGSDSRGSKVEVAGTCALYYVEPGVYELAKMAVAPEFQGQGLSRRLMTATEQWAVRKGARKIILYSNDSLKPAMALYHSEGYQEIEMGPTDYERCNIAMEKALSTFSMA